MNNPEQNDVSTALSLLRDSLAEEEQRIRNEGATAMQGGDYDTATAVIDFGKRLLAFQKKVEGLVHEWDELEDLRDKASPAVQEIVSKRFFGKSKKGEITPHEAYCRPLLEVLVEMGGSGKTKIVLDRLGEKMKPVLKPKDYESQESDSKTIRWRNTAQWARNQMANEDGRMRSDSPRGIWEISEKGRKWLREQSGVRSRSNRIEGMESERPRSER
ncbi:MAG: winged helix-turn-helix domain-containing protein [Verrucomicrobiales bacterium]|nr:winged helix-turn-helix domain-containing protein [Verrucomicrobiales bacterium]